MLDSRYPHFLIARVIMLFALPVPYASIVCARVQVLRSRIARSDKSRKAYFSSVLPVMTIHNPCLAEGKGTYTSSTCYMPSISA